MKKEKAIEVCWFCEGENKGKDRDNYRVSFCLICGNSGEVVVDIIDGKKQYCNAGIAV